MTSWWQTDRVASAPPPGRVTDAPDPDIVVVGAGITSSGETFRPGNELSAQNNRFRRSSMMTAQLNAGVTPRDHCGSEPLTSTPLQQSDLAPQMALRGSRQSWWVTGGAGG